MNKIKEAFYFSNLDVNHELFSKTNRKNIDKTKTATLKGLQKTKLCILRAKS